MTLLLLELTEVATLVCLRRDDLIVSAEECNDGLGSDGGGNGDEIGPTGLRSPLLL